MNKIFGKSFLKHFDILDPKIKRQFFRRLDLFESNPISPQLRNHTLKGNLLGLRAFSVTGDYRAIYQFTDQNTIKFIDIGRHGQIY